MGSIFDLITSPANDDTVLRKPALAAEATSPDSPLGALGGTLLSSLFGPQLSSVGDLVTRSAGLPTGSGSSLLRMAAPLVLGFLGRRVSSGGLNLAGLSNLLLGERDQIMRAAPTGLASLVGLKDIGRDASIGAAAPRVSTPAVSAGLPRWLWPALAALAIVAVVWALARNRQPTADETAGAVSEAVVDTMDTVEPATSDATLGPDVVGVTWEWVSFTTPVEQLKVDAPDRYTIRFGDDGRIAVRADCNRGTAAYSVGADRRLTLKPMALTRAACPPGSLSDRYAREVSRATSYFLKDGDLFLSLPVTRGRSGSGGRSELQAPRGRTSQGGG